MEPVFDFWSYLSIILFAVFISFILISIVIYMLTNPYPVVIRYEDEEYYYDPKAKSKLKFPSINEAESVNLSVVVPAYNEMERLPAMLDEALTFLEERCKDNPAFTYEVIIVSDGSTDKTVDVATSYVDKYGCDKLRCLQLVKNRGKGGAVRLGVQSSRGAAILFADADGASKFEDITKLEGALELLLKCQLNDTATIAKESAVIIGSRAHLEQESLATRSVFRNILMYGFHFLVWVLTVRGVRDTQCGFKLFTRRAARVCFTSLHVNRWAFDVELLYIAQKLNIPIVEIPVRWTEIEGSKVTPVLSWVQMGCDLALIWLRYTLRAWKLNSN